MQNQFVGDIGDYAKYALLRAVVGNRHLGIAWYLHPNIQGAGGNHIHYLGNQRMWRDVDPPLFNTLREIVHGGGRRSVARIQKRDVLPGAVFADERLRTPPGEQRIPWRHGWYERVQEKLADCGMVFIDPDNSLCQVDQGIDFTWQRLPLYEAEGLAANGRPTVIYHHIGSHRGQGKTADEEIRHWIAVLPNCNYTFRCRRGTSRTFFVLNADDAIINDLNGFANRWLQAEGRARISPAKRSALIPVA